MTRDSIKKIMDALPRLWALEEVLEEEEYRELPDEADLVETRSWVCLKSPTGFCCFDEKNDQCLDNCLICGDPDERK